MSGIQIDPKFTSSEIATELINAACPFIKGTTFNTLTPCHSNSHSLSADNRSVQNLLKLEWVLEMLNLALPPASPSSTITNKPNKQVRVQLYPPALLRLLSLATHWVKSGKLTPSQLLALTERSLCLYTSIANTTDPVRSFHTL